MNNSQQDLLRTTLRQFRGGLLVAVFLSFFLMLLHLVVPLYMIQIYGRVISSGSIDTLIMLTVVAVGALIVYGILDYFRSRVYLVMGEALGRRLNLPTLQASIVDSLHGDSASTSQASRDLNDLRSFVTGAAISVPLEILWSPIFLIVLFLIHPVFGIIAVISAAILIGMSVAADLLTRPPLAEASAAGAASFGEVGAAVRNGEVIEAMGMLPSVAKRWQKSQFQMLSLLDTGNTLGKGLAAVSRSLRLIMQIAVIGAGAVLVIQHLVAPGAMLAAMIILGRFLQPFEQLIVGWRQWVFAITAWNRVRDLLNRQTGRRQTLAFPTPDGRLVVDRVVYIPKGCDQAVLKGISFSLEPGEVLGVVGPSAAGKSTLARLLVGVWAPTTGGIYLDGHNVYLWERENFGKYVGYLPQSVSLMHGTVRENIARMAADADPRAIIKAARQAGVHEMIGRLPFGYETTVGDNGYSLSGGQRQRIALPRPLSGEPRFIVLDEPNSNLDAEGEQALLHAIGEARRGGATVVLIAHRPSIMVTADKLLVLKDGLVDQFGDRAEVMRSITRTAAGTGGRETPGSPRAVAAVPKPVQLGRADQPGSRP